MLVHRTRPSRQKEELMQRPQTEVRQRGRVVGVQGTKDRGEEEGTSQGAIGIEILQTLQPVMKTWLLLRLTGDGVARRSDITRFTLEGSSGCKETGKRLTQWSW